MSDLVLRVAAKALIKYEGKFLLLRESAPDGTEIGKYQIPGGQVEIGEDFMAGLRREVKEETALEVKPIQPIMIDGWFPTISGVKHQIIAIFYLCQSSSDQVRLSHEHDAYIWIESEEVSNYEVPYPVPKLFQKYQELNDKKRDGQ